MSAYPPPLQSLTVNTAPGWWADHITRNSWVARKQDIAEPGTLLNKLEKLDVVREPILSSGTKPMSGEEFFWTISQSKENIEAIYLQAKGRLRSLDDSCWHCRDGIGIFDGCVTVPGLSQCANCHWDGQKDRCDLYDYSRTETSSSSSTLSSEEDETQQQPDEHVKYEEQMELEQDDLPPPPLPSSSQQQESEQKCQQRFDEFHDTKPVPKPPSSQQQQQQQQQENEGQQRFDEYEQRIEQLGRSDHALERLIRMYREGQRGNLERIEMIERVSEIQAERNTETPHMQHAHLRRARHLNNVYLHTRIIINELALALGTLQ